MALLDAWLSKSIGAATVDCTHGVLLAGWLLIVNVSSWLLLVIVAIELLTCTEIVVTAAVGPVSRTESTTRHARTTSCATGNSLILVHFFLLKLFI